MSAQPTLFDTHCHLDYIQRQEGDYIEAEKAKGVTFDAASVLARAQAEGVEFIVNPSVTPARFSEILAIAEGFDHVYAALAVHPTDVKDVIDTPDWLSALEAGLSHPKVVAIGETGLDYYWDTSLKELQHTCFKALLALGKKHDLPVIVHDRDAHEDVAKIIESVPGCRGIMHCFSGDTAFAQRMIALGFFISFAGNVTFKKATDLQEAAKSIPLEWLLIETDSPFLSPMPFRGKPNEPARVRHVAQFIADLRGISYEEVAQVTTANAKRVFGL